MAWLYLVSYSGKTRSIKTVTSKNQAFSSFEIVPVWRHSKGRFWTTFAYNATVPRWQGYSFVCTHSTKVFFVIWPKLAWPNLGYGSVPHFTPLLQPFFFAWQNFGWGRIWQQIYTKFWQTRRFKHLTLYAHASVHTIDRYYHSMCQGLHKPRVPMRYSRPERDERVRHCGECPFFLGYLLR